MKRGVGSSRVPRPNTLNVDLHGADRDVMAPQSARTPKSASGAMGSGSAVARSAIRAGGGSSSTGTSPALPSALHHHSHGHGSVTARAASPASSSFNDELNRLLHADQLSLGMGLPTASGSSSGFPSPSQQGAASASGSGNKRPPIGGRRLVSVAQGHQSPPSVPSPSHAAGAGFVHSNALPPLRTAAPAGSTSPLVAQSARGPRPRALGGLGSNSGAYTSRIAAKDAATAAAAAAAYAQQREVSSDSDSESDDGRGQPNAVSVNAAAALYASSAAASSSASHALPHSHPALHKMQTMPAPTSSAAGTAASSSFNPQSSPKPGALSPCTPGGTEATAPSEFPLSAEKPSGSVGGSEKDRFAAVDAFALSTPKQKTGTVLTLSAHLTRGPLTPYNLDKARAVWRWICENITWIPAPASLGIGAEGTRGVGAGGGASLGAGESARAGVPLLLERSESTPVGRARGVSEASAAAREAAKAAAESKMMEAEQARMGVGALGRMTLIDDDDEDEMDGNGGGSFRAGGGPGQSRSGGSHSVDVLSDPGEILRRRRASTEGLANLFQSLLDGGGVECAKVEGYGKGCGLVRVAERFDAPQHFWNAFRLSPQDQKGGGGGDGGSGSAAGWALVDVAWSLGYINGAPPRLEKTFSPAYFKLNPTIFALQHFPTRCHPPPGRKAISKQLSDFVKAPEKLQLLEFSGPSAAGSGNGGDGGGPVVRRCISKTQFEDAMMIERGYLDLSVLALHPLGQTHTVRTDTPLFTISLQAPNQLEFAVAFNAPQKSSAATAASASSPPRFVDQCWHVSSTPLSDDPSQSRIDILLVFPHKGTYTVTVRARRLASKILAHDDVLHYRVLASCGFYDIRKERDVFVGFLARRLAAPSADHEFESKFALTRPIKGHFELGQPVRLQIVAPQQVTRMVAVNNGRWIELQSAPMSASNNGNGNGGSGSQSQSLSTRNRQVFEGDLKLLRFPDIQVHYKTKGQQFNLLYRYGVTEGGADGSVSGSGSGGALSLTNGAASGGGSGSGDGEDRHGKIVLDSRGTCFEKRLHIKDLKIGKRSAALLFDTKAGTAVKAEVRAGWNSAVKVSDKISVTQTGSRSAGEGGQGGSGGGSAGGGGSSSGPIGSTAQYDVVSWDVTTALSAAGLYSVHIFISSAGSGVYRFALVLYLRIGDRDAQGVAHANGRGFNLDV